MMRVEIGKIVVGEGRHRKAFVGIAELAQSIREHGQIQPIIVDEEYNLIAGERRLRACVMLGMGDVWAEFRGELDEFGKQAIELEENLRRENLTWPEEVTAKEKLHSLYIERYGEPIPGSHYSGWSIEKTADMLGQGLGNTSEDITLARAIQSQPDLAQIGSKARALKVMKVRKERVWNELIAGVMMESMQESGLDGIECVCGDGGEVLREYEEGSFDFCVTDPPYAMGFDGSVKGKRSWKENVFEDGENTFPTLERVMGEVYRVLKEGSHCYVFFAISQYTMFREVLEGVGFGVRPHPLIWVKTEETGIHPIATDSLHDYNSVYEAVFYCWKGQRRGLSTPNSKDVFMYPPPPVREKSHPAEKPLSLIRYLIEQGSVKGERGVDPFMGSGTFLLACKESGRMGVGVEVDKGYWVEAKVKLGIKNEKEEVI